MVSRTPMASLSWQKMDYAQGQRRPIKNLLLSDVWCKKEVIFQTSALSSLCMNTKRWKERKSNKNGFQKSKENYLLSKTMHFAFVTS
jgi:hypothetical protein